MHFNNNLLKRYNLTELQYAALLGMHDIVLDLLLNPELESLSEKDVSSTISPCKLGLTQQSPLQLAIENQHQLTALIILCFNPDTRQLEIMAPYLKDTLDVLKAEIPLIRMQLILQGLQTSEKRALGIYNKIYPQNLVISALELEGAASIYCFALSKNYKKFALVWQNRNPEMSMPNTELASSTLRPLYWYCKMNVEAIQTEIPIIQKDEKEEKNITDITLYDITKIDNDWISSLQQLEQDASANDQFVKLLCQLRQYNMLSVRQFSMLEPLPKRELINLKSAVSNAPHDAIEDDFKILKNFDEQKDYVSLNQLWQHYTPQLFLTMMQSQDMALFYWLLLDSKFMRTHQEQWLATNIKLVNPVPHIVYQAFNHVKIPGALIQTLHARDAHDLSRAIQQHVLLDTDVDLSDSRLELGAASALETKENIGQFDACRIETFCSILGIDFKANLMLKQSFLEKAIFGKSLPFVIFPLLNSEDLTILGRLSSGIYRLVNEYKQRFIANKASQMDWFKNNKEMIAEEKMMKDRHDKYILKCETNFKDFTEFLARAAGEEVVYSHKSCVNIHCGSLLEITVVLSILAACIYGIVSQDNEKSGYGFIFAIIGAYLSTAMLGASLGAYRNSLRRRGFSDNTQNAFSNLQNTNNELKPFKKIHGHFAEFNEILHQKKTQLLMFSVFNELHTVKDDAALRCSSIKRELRRIKIWQAPKLLNDNDIKIEVTSDSRQLLLGK